jgi:hypothetical protein
MNFYTGSGSGKHPAMMSSAWPVDPGPFWNKQAAQLQCQGRGASASARADPQRPGPRGPCAAPRASRPTAAVDCGPHTCPENERPPAPGHLACLQPAAPPTSTRLPFMYGLHTFMIIYDHDVTVLTSMYSC